MSAFSDHAPSDNVVTGIAPPHSIEAEQSVLGAMLLSEKTHYSYVIEEQLKPDDFYVERHKVIFEAIVDLFSDSKPIDVLTVTERLRDKGQLDAVGGDAEIDALTATVPVVPNVRSYAEIVRQRAMLRRVLTATYAIQASVHNHEHEAEEIVEHAEKAMLEVARDDRKKDFRAIGKVLEFEIERWHQLSIDGNSMTGTPSGFADLDEITGGFQPGALIIIAARPAMGKCNSFRTIVIDGQTGLPRQLGHVVEQFVEGGDAVTVASLGQDWKLRPAKVVAVHRNGVREVFRMRTKLGRETAATANHPFLTIGGWRTLEELTPGDRVAVARRIPGPALTSTMPDAELVVLAGMIADGCVTKSTPQFTFARDAPMLHVMREAVEEMGARIHVSPDGMHGYLSAGRGTPNPVTDLCRRHGIWGKKGDRKSVPEAIFRLPEHQVARFLGVLFACDGHIHATDRLRQIGYTTISEQLAKDVQHLLLRLGIVGKIRTLKRDVYEGTDKVAREVLITGQEDLRAFVEKIDVPGKLPQLARLMTGLELAPASTDSDTLPMEAWAHVVHSKGARSWAEVSEAGGYPRNHNWHVAKRGLSRPRAAQLATLLDDGPLMQLAESDVWWDEVVAIEPAGEEETFDLTIEGTHNFVADDIVVHNSALVTNIAENVALHPQNPKPVALFSLEMAEAELAQRFIASQSGIKGDDLRKGRLRDERKWKRVLDTVARYDAAPLFVDDSSDVSLLDIRAKCRRLHQQTHKEFGGLGLVVVDYLQLMRADARVESRVLQIGEMSRGLKILARELEVPVIALSQLSRAVESRNDKRPMLSDLRESGCVTGDTLVHLPQTGERRPIAELVGRHDFDVLAVDPSSWKLESARATNVFCTGSKPVFRLTTALGRTVRATGNHQFLAFDGWRRLDEMHEGDHLALPRMLPEPTDETDPLSCDELALLGHLIGDGCTLPRHAIQVTTNEDDLAHEIARLATAVFGDRVAPRIVCERRWLQVFLPSTRRLAPGQRNPIAAWLDELGIFGLRSHEKRVPDTVLRCSNEGIATFLRHLWSTDGCVWSPPFGTKSAPRIYYATSSRRLAEVVQHLLLRLGIRACLRQTSSKGERSMLAVDISGRDDVLAFTGRVGAVGTRRGAVTRQIEMRAIGQAARTNRDVVPRAAWRDLAVPAMKRAGLTTRGLQAALPMSYSGSMLYASNLSRSRACRVADIVDSDELDLLAHSDVYWDTVQSIEPAGVEPVYDITVERLHNFVAGDVVVHNSIEQDADLVAFIYRDEYYYENTDSPGEAELIIAKHRQGATDTVRLTFQGEYPKFMSLQRAG